MNFKVELPLAVSNFFTTQNLDLNRNFLSRTQNAYLDSAWLACTCQSLMYASTVGTERFTDLDKLNFLMVI